MGLHMSRDTPMTPPPLVLTFVSEDYIPIGRNWLRHVQATAPDAMIRMVALDEATRAAFPEEIVQYDPPEGQGLARLWLHRLAVMRTLLEQGHDIIHSDADAIWCRDPRPHIAACKTEMVFSQGTVWPPDVHARHGVVLCCGFFFMQSTPAVRRFMQEVNRRVETDRDDQVSVNRLLVSNGVRWELPAPYQIAFRDKAFSASREIGIGHVESGPSVALLPHHLFPRLVEPGTSELEMSDIVVAHPLSPKVCSEKIDSLSRLGLWVQDL